jgi:hypothetical protein
VSHAEEKLIQPGEDSAFARFADVVEWRPLLCLGVTSVNFACEEK